jgi:hypothetical protein
LMKTPKDTTTLNTSLSDAMMHGTGVVIVQKDGRIREYEFNEIVYVDLGKASRTLAAIRDDAIVLTPAEKADILGPQIGDIKFIEAPAKPKADNPYTKPQHPRSYRR